MLKATASLLFALLLPRAALAADLGAPKLSPPLSTLRFFDTNSFLTSGGVRISSGKDNVALEPQLGVGYRAQERDICGASSESTHRVHAQAGWRFSLPEIFYLSAAAKLPVFSYQSTEHTLGTDPTVRHDYDFQAFKKNPLSWTGEVGLHLTGQADLTVYYDKDLSSGAMPGLMQQEQRLGTRFIWRFK